MVNRLELEINLGFSAPYSEELNKEVIEEYLTRLSEEVKDLDSYSSSFDAKALSNEILGIPE